MADSDFGTMHLAETRPERPEQNRKIRVTDRISTEFLLLVEQLLQQHSVELEEVKQELRESREQLAKSKSAAEGPRGSSAAHFRQTQGFDNFEALRKTEMSREVSEKEKGKVSELSKVSSRRSSKSMDSVERKKGGAAKALLRSKREREAIPQVEAGAIIEMLEDHEEDLEQTFQVNQENIDTDAIPGLLADTDSVLAERYRNLTRFEKLQYQFQSPQYEMVIFSAVYLNVLWMAFELHMLGIESWHLLNKPGEVPEDWSQIFFIGDLMFAIWFVLDVVIRVSVLQCLYWKSWMNWVDLVVSLLAIFEVALTLMINLPVAPVIFRLMRIGRLVRAVRMVTMTSSMGSLQLLVKCLASSRDMLLCSFSILTFVQCVAGVILCTLCMDFVQDETQDPALRQEVFQYYGTFTRTFLSMFEILFANWGPPCRVLVDNISEWFSIFFLIYRCVLGFAVLNVVNAVFVQQTMRTAHEDEDLAYKQRQKEIDLYAKKVKTLFQGLDSTGDGAINLEEFSKLVKSDKLAFWMSQLELEYHDLLQLFEFLDNGDGQITLTEFIDGAARLRGGAKAIDVWRMETKLEVLFEEVLDAMHQNDERKRSTVHEVLHNSSFKFINSNVHDQGLPQLDPRSSAIRRSSMMMQDTPDSRASILSARSAPLTRASSLGRMSTYSTGFAQ